MRPIDLLAQRVAAPHVGNDLERAVRIGRIAGGRPMAPATGYKIVAFGQCSPYVFGDVPRHAMACAS